MIEEEDIARERDKPLEEIKFQPTRMKLVVLTSNIKHGRDMNLKFEYPSIEVEVEEESQSTSVTDVTSQAIGPMNSLTMKM